MKKYESLAHPSDIGITAYGKSLEEAFSNSAYGMFDMMTDLSKVKEEKSYEVSASGDDRESLLVAWLSELIFLYDTKYAILKRFEIKKLTDKKIETTVFGQKIDPKKHRFGHVVKAVTYNQLEIKKENTHWIIHLVFDV